MSEALAFWKVGHVLSAAILLGTGIAIVFFCWFGIRRALRTDDIAALRLLLGLTLMAEAWIILPAAVFQGVSGLVLMQMHGWSLASPWSEAAWGLFAFAGVCWLPAVLVQIRLSREADRATSIGDLPARIHWQLRFWAVLAILVYTAVALLFYLMIAKPLAITLA